MLQIARAICEIVRGEERALRGGALLYLTTPRFAWPDAVLVREIPKVLLCLALLGVVWCCLFCVCVKVLAGARSWKSLASEYQQFLSFAQVVRKTKTKQNKTCLCKFSL